MEVARPNLQRFVFLLVALVLMPALTLANESSPPLQLRSIMQQLGRDMQAVVAAISSEDWAQVATLAPRIASHDQPSMAEKARILGWIGKDAASFRNHDGETHEAALTLREAGLRRDGPAVIDAFARVQRSCLDCHQQFRQQFVEHFYGGGP